MANSLLIIDDSPLEREQIKHIIGAVPLIGRIYEGTNGIEGLRILLAEKIDLVLCDVVMPTVDGFKFLAMKKTRAELTDVPVIMLTGKEDLQAKVASFELGANDYITKPFVPEELIARIKAHLRIKNLQDDLKKVNVRLEELSNTDALTGIYNRRYCTEILEKEVDRARRYGSRLSFLMIDIDNFKAFNDTYGHLVGDMVLTEVAHLLQSGLRKTDTVARYGGEEFALLLPETDPKGSLAVAERYRAQVQAHKFGSEKDPLRVTISIGLSHYPSPVIESVDDLIRLADNALYKAKSNGRNKVETSHHEDLGEKPPRHNADAGV